MSSSFLVQVGDAVRTKGTAVQQLATIRFIWVRPTHYFRISEYLRCRPETSDNQANLLSRPFQGSTTEYHIIFDSVLDYLCYQIFAIKVVSPLQFK